jgi:HAE1 family hydrophobic/amphiphilic exporter-1
MKIIDFSIRRPVTVSMVTVAVIIFGLVSAYRLPISLLPTITYPAITIETKYQGAAPEEVENLITKPIEEAVGVVSGIQRIVSRSKAGLSQVVLEFAWGRNIDFAQMDVREKLDLVLLPDDADDPMILRFDPDSDPVMRLALSGSKDLAWLRYVAEEDLKKDLESMEGVAAIKVNGGLEEEIQVVLDEGKLSALGLRVADVNQALLGNNVNLAGGSLYEAEARYLVRTFNEFQDVSDIAETIILERENRKVFLKDIGRVERGHKEREVITHVAGKEAVELAIYKEGDANTVQMARKVNRALGMVKKRLPEGITLSNIYDQSYFISQSVKEVISNAVFGGLIAIFILFFFLKDIKSTSIIGISIPISIIATFFLMYQMGVSMNIMSIGGLALGVGMLVDNSIVVLEAIFRHKGQGKSPAEASNVGTSEVAKAVAASTLTTVAVFIPIIFVQGIAAQLFRDQALTVSFSLLASLVVAITLIPMMASWTIRRNLPETSGENPGNPGDSNPTATDNKKMGFLRKTSRKTGNAIKLILSFLFVSIPSLILKYVGKLIKGIYWILLLPLRPALYLFDKAFSAVSNRYPGILTFSLRHRFLVVFIAFVLFAFSLLALNRLGIELIPSLAQGEYYFRLELHPQGVPLEVTDRVVSSIERKIEEVEGIASIYSSVGSYQLTTETETGQGENIAQINITMKERGNREAEKQAIKKIRAILTDYEGVDYKFGSPTIFTFRTPVEVEIYGDNIDEVMTVSHDIASRVRQIRGVVDVKSSLQEGNPELQVVFNRDKLAKWDLDLLTLSNIVRQKIKGEVATQLNQGEREVDIRVRTHPLSETSIAEVENLIITDVNGIPIRLRSVAHVIEAIGPSEIRRIGQRRAAVVTANLSGIDLGTVSGKIDKILEEYPFPLNVSAQISGENQEMSRSFRSLLFAFALAIFLVYFVMAAQFESFIRPFIIIFTVPLGLIGVVIVLSVTGNIINIVVLIGIVMLSGIVVNNAIVLVDYIGQLRAAGKDKFTAILEAAKVRFRPILMTAITTILGLTPMALGLGEGAEIRTPLAITVIGGLAFATILTLVVIPCVYAIVDRKGTLVIPEYEKRKESIEGEAVEPA